MKIKNLILLVFIFFSSACTVVDKELLELVIEIKNQNQELLNEVKSLQSKSDSLITELKNSASKQKELMDQVTKLQGDLAKILTEIGKLNDRLNTQGADIDAIKAQMTTLQVQYQTIITQLEQLQQLSKILAEIELLKGQLSALNGNQQELIGLVGQNQQDLQTIKSLLEFINTQTESSQKKLSELTVQLGKQGADIKTLLEQYQVIEKQFKELVKLGQILEEIQSLKSQFTDLNQKYNILITSLGQNQEAINSLKSQVAALQTELNEKLEQIMNLLGSLIKQNSDNEAILVKIEELKLRLEEIANLLNELLNNSNNGGNQPEIELIAKYPAGTIFCADGPTEIIDVINPKTGKTWMDRNLGASRSAINNSDSEAYGDYYQWGRRADGHQCRDSKTTIILSSSDQPSHGDFILAANSPFDWRSPQNSNLWQGVNGVNNPCPSGYRVPTEAEFVSEYLSWEDRTIRGGYESPLRWVMTGLRSDGAFFEKANSGHNWASNISSNGGNRFIFGFAFSAVNNVPRATGVPVRCIKN